MTACEKCWRDARFRQLYNPCKTQAEHYRDLLEERKHYPCEAPPATEPEPKKCVTCHGLGELVTPFPLDNVTCHKCGGTGKAPAPAEGAEQWLTKTLGWKINDGGLVDFGDGKGGRTAPYPNEAKSLWNVAASLREQLALVQQFLVENREANKKLAAALNECTDAKELLEEQLGQARLSLEQVIELLHAATEDYGNAKRELEEARAKVDAAVESAKCFQVASEKKGLALVKALEALAHISMMPLGDHGVRQVAKKALAHSTGTKQS